MRDPLSEVRRDFPLRRPAQSHKVPVRKVRLALGLISAFFAGWLLINAIEPAAAGPAPFQQGQTDFIRQIPLNINDVVYSSTTSQLYASVPSSVGTGGNSIASVNPVTGSVGTTTFIGSEPNKLALSDDGNTLYAGLDGAFAVRRMDIATQTPGLQFALGAAIGSPSRFVANDIAVAPGNSNLVTVARFQPGLSPPEVGVAAFDNGVILPNIGPSHSNGSDTLAFSASASKLFGGGSFGGLRTMTLDANGITQSSIGSFNVGSRVKFTNGQVFTSNGQVINSDTGALIGTFSGATSNAFVADATFGRAYYLTGNQTGGPGTLTLKVYEISTFSQIGSLSIPNVSGTPTTLIRWGSNGLAFRTTAGHFYLIQTSLIPSGDPIPTPTATVSPTPNPSPTPFSAFVRQVSVTANDVIYNEGNQFVYVSVPSSAGAGGNSITAVDPVTGNIGTSFFVGSEPTKFVKADDGQTAYVFLDGASQIRRVNLTSFSGGIQFPIGLDNFNGPYGIFDIAVAPGNANLVGVARRWRGSSPGEAGVAVFENGVQRPNTTNPDADLLAFESPSKLYSAGRNGLNTITVDANGVTNAGQTSLLPSFGGIKVKNGLVYSTSGQVVDPATGVAKGTYALGGDTATALAIDVPNNRIFFTVQNSNRPLRAFELNTFVPVGHISLAGVGVSTTSLVRWGSNGLALRGFDGRLVLIQSGLINPSDPGPAPTPTPSPAPSPTPPYIPTFFRRVNQTANDLVYSADTQGLYASVPSTAAANGNSITKIVPETGAIGPTAFVGSEPTKMAISADGKTLYVSLNGAGAARRVDVPSLTPGLQFPIFTQNAYDMEVVPGSTQSVAVARTSVVIYDDGVARPNNGGSFPEIGPIEFGATTSTLYGFGPFSTGNDLVKFSVDGSGVTKVRQNSNLMSGGLMTYNNGLLYSSSRVIDPENLTVKGTFSNTIFPSGMVLDAANNRIFYLGANSGTAVITAFDINTFLPIGSISIPSLSGSFGNLKRWGTNGLAFTTTGIGLGGQVVILQTELVSNAASIPTGIELSAANYAVNEGNANATITVNRLGDVSSTSTINYSTSNGTATAGSDYAATSGTLTFSPGQLSRTIAVPIINDTLFEGSPAETFTVNLSDPTGSVLTAPSSAVVSINDNDGQPLISSPSVVSTPEGNSGSTNLPLTISLTNPSTQTVTVNYATADGTATAGSDYAATSGTLTFPPGTTSAIINVAINGDTLIESNETFAVNLSNSVNGFLLNDAIVVTINNDDGPAIQFGQSTYTVNESASFLSIDVTRTGDTSIPSTVKYSTSDATDVNFNCNPNTAGQIVGAASRKCDYHIAAGRLRFAAGESSKTIVLSIVNDVYVEGSETLNISLSSPTGGVLGSPNLATITISDTDTPGQANPIDGTGFYVRMLYVDLLSREPEPGGFNGWVHRIDFCGQPGEPPPPCDRVTVGGDGFLRSAEFFDREFFVIRLYRTALGRILRYDDVGDLAYVSGFLTDADLELNKQEVVAEIMSRPEFSNTYNGMSNAQYVDTMIFTAAVTLPVGVRDGWVNALNGAAKTRAQVFRELSERPEVSAKYLHEAQVVSCYYGFFTRNPDGAYFTFLQRYDNGEITLGDLANAFINAAEYRQRFGP